MEHAARRYAVTSALSIDAVLTFVTRMRTGRASDLCTGNCTCKDDRKQILEAPSHLRQAQLVGTTSWPAAIPQHYRVLRQLMLTPDLDDCLAMSLTSHSRIIAS